MRPKKVGIISAAEYLSQEEAGSVRHEFVRGRLFAMTGSSAAHNTIAGNIFVELKEAIRTCGCRVFINDLKVKIEKLESYYYPDIVLTCEPLQGSSSLIEQPQIIVEVLSPSTMQIDRREKLLAYLEIESLKYYVIVYQDRMLLELYSRDDHSTDSWNKLILSKSSVLNLLLYSQTISIPLERIYEDVSFDPMVKEMEDEYSLL